MLFRFQYIKNLKKDFLEYVVYTYTYAFLVQCSHVNSKIFMLIINYEYIPFILYTCLMYLIENINGTLLWNLRIKSQLWPLVFQVDWSKVSKDQIPTPIFHFPKCCHRAEVLLLPVANLQLMLELINLLLFLKVPAILWRTNS